MVAAPQIATFRFRGLATGRSISVSTYISDVVGANVRFNQVGKAGTGSGDSIRFKEAVMLDDISIPTGLTDTTTLVAYNDGVPVAGSAIQYANFLNSINTRKLPTIAFDLGAVITFAQS